MPHDSFYGDASGFVGRYFTNGFGRKVPVNSEGTPGKQMYRRCFDQDKELKK